MPKPQNGINPYSGENPELTNQMEIAMGEAALPPVRETINGSHYDDGYSLTDRVAYLEGEILRLDDELKSHKERSRNAFWCSDQKQALSSFEENLALFIYPRGRRFGNIDIFPSLMNWLNARRGTEQGVVANNKWLQVTGNLLWNRNHGEVLTKFRNLSLASTIEAVETWNPVSFTEVEKNCIDDFKRLNKLLTEWIENEENEMETLSAL